MEKAKLSLKIKYDVDLSFYEFQKDKVLEDFNRRKREIERQLEQEITNFFDARDTNWLTVTNIECSVNSNFTIKENE